MLTGILIGALVGVTVGVIVMALVNAGARADECAECQERQRRSAWTLEFIQGPPLGEEDTDA